MVVVRCTTGGSYILAELDCAVSRLCCATFRIIAYSAGSPDDVSILSLLFSADLQDIALQSEDYPLADDRAEVVDYPLEDLN